VSERAIVRKWLQALVDEYLLSVERLQNTPEDLALAIEWATWMRQQWATHGMAELKQQRNLMTDVRGAIKAQLGEHHVALEGMNFTVAEWTMINAPIADQVARRNENVVLLDNAEAIVAQAVRLLEQREWAEVAAGLVVLTGRRSSEILGTANFQAKSQWSVIFTGALKRRGEAHLLSFEIPTLTTAERVITALAKLRQMCSTEGLSAEQINQKYSQAVATACDRHFSNLVPHRDGRDNLFTHLFRSVYAAIATYWYAPPTVDASEYKAAIQGHYTILETTDGELKRSLAASRHYNDYKIGDRAGNIDGRQGIKLGYGGVEVIEVFNKSRPPETIDMAFQLEVDPFEGDRQPDDLEVTAMVTTQEVSQQAIESVSEALGALPEIEPKEQPEDSIVSKRRQPRRVKPIAVDLELLKTVAGHFGIEIRSGKGQGYDHALAELLSLLEQNATLAVSAKQRAPSDSPHIEPAAPISQTVADQAKTLAWLTGRVETLEAEINQLQQEKQKARCLADTAGVTPSLSLENEQSQQEINQLHDENNRLKTELLQTQSRLEGIQRFLNGGAIERTAQEKKATAAIESNTPTDAIKHQTSSLTALPIPQKVSEAVLPQADLDPDVLRALQALLDYNEYEATSHPQRWAISIPVMKDLLKQLGKATQPKIEAVLRAKRGAIEQHHRHHGLGERHNRVHKGRSISEVIKL
jgi:Telomere resolvase